MTNELIGSTKVFEECNFTVDSFLLHEDFFKRREIKKLRKISGGNSYVIIYLKILLLSVKEGGIITFYKTEKTLAAQVSLDIDEDENDVAIVFNFMEKEGLMIELSSGEGSKAYKEFGLVDTTREGENA